MNDTNAADNVGPAVTHEASDGRHLLELCEKHKLELFCDQRKVPMVQIPNDKYEKAHAIDSPRFSAWLANEFYQSKSRFAAARDIENVLRVLEGRAWNEDRRQPVEDVLWFEIEGDAVLSGLVRFLNQLKLKQASEISGKTSELFKNIRELQPSTRRFPQGRGLPANTQALSRRLRSAATLLAGIGVRVSIEHHATGSHYKITAEDGFCAEDDAITVSPSKAAQTGKHQRDKDLAAVDGNEASNLAHSVNSVPRPETLEELRRLGGE